MTARKIFQVVFINLVVLLLVLVLLEMGSRLLFGYNSDHREFRSTQPAPYRDAPYFSAEFIDESFTQPGGWEVRPGTGLLFPKDFSGTYFTVVDGVRLTTDVPAVVDRTLHLYGGSTVYCSEVPDSHTLASYLQRRLVEGGHDRVAVINKGVTSINTNQQLERLQHDGVTPGDLVVFYDGVNEVIQGVIFGNPSGNIVYRDLSRPKWQRTLVKMANYSSFVRRFFTELTRNYEVHDLQARVQRAAARYGDNLASAQEYVERHGGTFVHFLQPQLYSLAQFGDYEHDLVSQGIVMIQAEAAFRAAYPALAEVVQERARSGSHDIGLESVLDKAEQPVYLDFCHVNHVGNALIADGIYAGLVRAGVLTGH